MNAARDNSWYTILLLVSAGMLPLYVIRCSIFGIPTNVFEIIVLVLVGVGLFLLEVRKSWVRNIKTMPLSLQIAIGLFLLSACVSTLISSELRVSLGILKGWVIIPIMFGFLIASAIKHNPSMRSRILDSLICSGVAVSCIGIFQIGSLARVTSLYDVPNSLALFLVPVVIIALYTGVQLKKRVYTLCALIMFVAVLATQSIGAIVSIVVTLCIAWALGATRKKQVYINIVVLLVAVSCIVLIFSGRIQYLLSPLVHIGAKNSATVRLQLWSVGAHLIVQHPILGIGLGQFEPAYQNELHLLFARHIAGLQPEYVFRDPHNWIISFWLNLGILGLLIFSYLNFISIYRSILSKNVEQRAVSLGLIAMLLYGLVDTIYWKNDLSALWWILFY